MRSLVSRLGSDCRLRVRLEMGALARHSRGDLRLPCIHDHSLFRLECFVCRSLSYKMLLPLVANTKAPLFRNHEKHQTSQTSL